MTVLEETATVSEETAEQQASQIVAAREAWLRDAHMLLELLHSRPDLPLPPYFEISVPVSSVLGEEDARNVVGSAAGALGVEPVSLPGQFGAGISIGRAHYYVFSVSDAELVRSREERRLGREAFEAKTEAPSEPVTVESAVETAITVEPVETEPVKKVPMPRSGRAKASTKQDGGELK